MSLPYIGPPSFVDRQLKIDAVDGRDAHGEPSRQHTSRELCHFAFAKILESMNCAN